MKYGDCTIHFTCVGKRFIRFQHTSQDMNSWNPRTIVLCVWFRALLQRTLSFPILKIWGRTITRWGSVCAKANFPYVGHFIFARSKTLWQTKAQSHHAVIYVLRVTPTIPWQHRSSKSIFLSRHCPSNSKQVLEPDEEREVCGERMFLGSFASRLCSCSDMFRPPDVLFGQKQSSKSEYSRDVLDKDFQQHEEWVKLGRQARPAE